MASSDKKGRNLEDKRCEEIAKMVEQKLCLSQLLIENKIKGVSEVREFLKSTSDHNEINKVQEDGLTPLMTACYQLKEDLVDFLLGKGADPSKVCLKKRNTALHYALQDNTNLRNWADMKPLYSSVDLQKKAAIVKSLLSKGATLTLNGENMSPLHTAAVHGLQDVVELFISDGSGVGVSLEEKVKAYQLLGVFHVVYRSSNVDHIIKARTFFQKAAEFSLKASDGDCPPDVIDLFRCFCNREYRKLGEDLEEDRLIWIKGYTLGASILPEKFKRENFWLFLVKLGVDALLGSGWGLETGIKLLRYLIQLEVKGQVELGSVLESMSNLFTDTKMETPKPLVMRYISYLLESYADGLVTVRKSVLRKHGRIIPMHVGTILSEISYYHHKAQHLHSLLAASERIIITINESMEASRGFKPGKYCCSAAADFIDNMTIGFYESWGKKLGKTAKTKENILFVFARLLFCDKASSSVICKNALQEFLGYSDLATEDMDHFYALTQLMVRYACTLKRKGDGGLVPKKAFMRAVLKKTSYLPDEPPFKRLFDLLSPSCNMLPLEEQAARVIMRNRIPYRGKLPAGLADIFEERYLGGNLKLKL